MVASNELDPAYFVETARLLFDLAVEIRQTLGIRFEFVNLGGGIGIPYRPEQEPVPSSASRRGSGRRYDELIVRNGLHPVKLAMECGRVDHRPLRLPGDPRAPPQGAPTDATSASTPAWPT